MDTSRWHRDTSILALAISADHMLGLDRALASEASSVRTPLRPGLPRYVTLDASRQQRSLAFQQDCASSPRAGSSRDSRRTHAQSALREA